MQNEGNPLGLLGGGTLPRVRRHWRVVGVGCFGDGIGVDGFLEGVGEGLVGEAGGGTICGCKDASFVGI